MGYPNVKNAHIVPRTYLENWALDGKVGVVVIATRKSLTLPVEKVGTRRRFYRRERPDGTPIDDVEASLAIGEDVATPILRTFADEWPLSRDDKATLAELLAYQLLRGPRWKDEYGERNAEIFDGWRRDPTKAAAREQLDELAAHFGSDSYRFMRMFTAAPTITSILGSTKWTLLDFHSPVVATSDHPVVLWPGAAARAPQPTRITEAGLLECIEIHVPLSPHHALLMTWAEGKDDRVGANRQDAEILNAFTVAHADEQWFHHPAKKAPVGTGSFLPLAPRLVPGYTAEAAATSPRRTATSEYAKSKVGRELDDREVTLIEQSN